MMNKSYPWSEYRKRWVNKNKERQKQMVENWNNRHPNYKRDYYRARILNTEMNNPLLTKLWNQHLKNKTK